MKLEHTDCQIYRGCPRCRQVDDRWEMACVIFCMLVVFTFVIPVIPVIVLIFLSL